MIGLVGKKVGMTRIFTKLKQTALLRLKIWLTMATVPFR